MDRTRNLIGKALVRLCLSSELLIIIFQKWYNKKKKIVWICAFTETPCVKPFATPLPSIRAQSSSISVDVLYNGVRRKKFHGAQCYGRPRGWSGGEAKGVARWKAGIPRNRKNCWRNMVLFPNALFLVPNFRKIKVKMKFKVKIKFKKSIFL